MRPLLSSEKDEMVIWDINRGNIKLKNNETPEDIVQNLPISISEFMKTSQKKNSKKLNLSSKYLHAFEQINRQKQQFNFNCVYDMHVKSS